MKARKKCLTERPAASLRKRLSPYRKWGIMNREQGMLKFEVRNIIARYFLFIGCCWKRILRQQGMLKFEVGNIIAPYFLFIGCCCKGIMNRKQGILKFEVGNIVVRYFLFIGCCWKGIMNREQRMLKFESGDHCCSIKRGQGKYGWHDQDSSNQYPYKKGTRRIIFAFHGALSREINTMAVQKKLRALADRYQWMPEWLNLVLSHHREETWGLSRHCLVRKPEPALVLHGTGNMLPKIFLRKVLSLQAEGGHTNNHLLIKTGLSQCCPSGS